MIYYFVTEIMYPCISRYAVFALEMFNMHKHTKQDVSMRSSACAFHHK